MNPSNMIKATLLFATVAFASIEQTNAAEFPLEYTYTQPARTVLNPDGGPWNHLDLIDLSPAELASKVQTYPKSKVTVGPLRLINLPICLNPVGRAYSACNPKNPDPKPITSADIATLDSAFAKVQAARIKVEVKFAYNDSGTGDDAPMPIIVQDIQKLAPIIAKYKNVIYGVDGGFIGAYGEGHDSTYNNDTPANMQIFMDAEMMYFGPYVTLLNRLPSNILDWEPRGKTIWGIHDAHFATGGTDSHTWNSPYWARFPYTTKTLLHFGELRSDQLPFMAELGSEESAYQTYDIFDAYCRRVHVNGMNVGFHTGYISQEAQFQDIINRIGPAIGLTRASLDIPPIAGGTSTLTLSFINTGYSRQFVKVPMYVVLADASENQLSSNLFTPVPVPMDVTSIASSGGESSASVKVKFPADLAPNSRYYVALWMPDPDMDLAKLHEYNYLLNNNNVPNPSTGLNQLFPVSFQ